MKKVLKITIILTMFFTILANLTSVYAVPVNGTNVYSGGGQISIQNSGIQLAKWSNQSTDWWKPTDPNVGEDEFFSKADIIVSVIRNVGIVISVIALMIIGIKEMTASVEEKSIINKAMPGYILGAIMVGAISFLPTIIFNIMKKI